jgi:hypothetical protein
MPGFNFLELAARFLLSTSVLQLALIRRRKQNLGNKVCNASAQHRAYQRGQIASGISSGLELGNAFVSTNGVVPGWSANQKLSGSCGILTCLTL